MINRTPHALHIAIEAPSHFGAPADTEWHTVILPAVGEPIRATMHQRDIGPIYLSDESQGYSGVEVPVKLPPRITGIRGHDDLPEGASVVVSMLAAEPLVRLRPDLTVYTPGPEIRDETGRIVGCRGLTKWSRSAAWVAEDHRIPMTHAVWAPQEPQNLSGGWELVARILATEESRWIGDMAPTPHRAGQAWANMLRMPVLVTAIEQGALEAYPGMEELQDGLIWPTAPEFD